MGITLPQVDYTDRDYASFKAEMISLIQTYVQEWTNISESDFGIILIELFCHMADSLAYYQDRQANESFLATAQLRQSVINLCALIGYKLAGAQPSSGTITFTITAQTSNFTIPAGTLLATQGSDTEDPVYFQTTEDLTILAGQTTGSVSVINGRPFTDTIGIGTQLPLQSYTLLRTGVIVPSPFTPTAITVTVNPGLGPVEWTYVPNLITALATDQVWTFTVDQNRTVTIEFGDGVNGAIPPNGSVIQASYNVGGGALTNVGAGTINTLISNIPHVVSVTNAAATSDGADEETIQHAQTYAPLYLATQKRAVTETDYATFAAGYPGVLDAGEQLGTVNGNIQQINLYILPSGGGQPSTGLKNAILAYIDTVKMAGQQIVINGPIMATVDISAFVNVLPNYSATSVETAVTAAITNFFTIGNFDFGQSVDLSALYNLISGITGVDYVVISIMTLEPIVTRVDNGTGNAVFGAVTYHAPAIAQLYTVTMTDATHFSVVGTESGAVGSGQLGVLFNSSDGQISFTITVGNVPMVAGNNWTIQTSNYVGNVVPDNTQVAQLGVLSLTMGGGF